MYKRQTIIAPLVSGLEAEAVDVSNVQQNKSVGGWGLRARLFSTGARLWGTSAIASARLWGTSAIARAISRLSAGGAGGVLSARLFSTFCLGPPCPIHEFTEGVLLYRLFSTFCLAPLSVAMIISIPTHKVKECVEVAGFRTACLRHRCEGEGGGFGPSRLL